MNARRLGPAVVGFDPYVDLRSRRLGITDFDIPIAVLVVVQKIEGRIPAAAAPVLGNEPIVGVGGLRIFVEIAQPAMAGGGVEVEIIFLDVLAAIALVAGQPKGALLEDRITAIPQCQCKAQTLLLVAQSAQPVLAPAIGSRAGLVMAEMSPGVAVCAVVLAHRPPAPLGQIGPPQAPVRGSGPLLVEALLLGVRHQ